MKLGYLPAKFVVGMVKLKVEVLTKLDSDFGG